jgi:hypothetical protein
MANNKTAATKKECFVVARYAFKTNKKLNGTVCSVVRNGEGEEYKVWTHSNGCASSCDCEGYTKWHKKCYHAKHAESVEQQRRAAVSTTTPAAVVIVAESEPVKVVETTAITDEDVQAVLAEIDALAQPIAAVVATTETVKAVETTPQPVAETPAPRKREVSSVEREMPAFLMSGGSRGGYLPGRAPATQRKRAS